MSKKHVFFCATLSIALIGAGLLAKQLELFRDDAQDYVKYDTSRQ